MGGRLRKGRPAISYASASRTLGLVPSMAAQGLAALNCGSGEPRLSRFTGRSTVGLPWGRPVESHAWLHCCATLLHPPPTSGLSGAHEALMGDRAFVQPRCYPKPHGVARIAWLPFFLAVESPV
jgi:hypothetical protein